MYLLSEETKKVIRKVDKISYKKNSCELAVIFNETCIKEGILPIIIIIMIIIVITISIITFLL